VKSRPWIAAATASRDSCASRMRRNRIQFSSGTYCRALAQLERRITSHTPFTKADREPREAIDLGVVFFWGGRDMGWFLRAFNARKMAILGLQVIGAVWEARRQGGRQVEGIAQAANLAWRNIFLRGCVGAIYNNHARWYFVRHEGGSPDR